MGGDGERGYKAGETFRLESFKGLFLSHRKSFAGTEEKLGPDFISSTTAVVI